MAYAMIAAAPFLVAGVFAAGILRGMAGAQRTRQIFLLPKVSGLLEVRKLLTWSHDYLAAPWSQWAIVAHGHRIWPSDVPVGVLWVVNWDFDCVYVST